MSTTKKHTIDVLTYLFMKLALLAISLIYSAFISIFITCADFVEAKLGLLVPVYPQQKRQYGRKPQIGNSIAAYATISI